MDVFAILNLNELALGLSNLPMFPFFDMAHYIISVMSLREQPGKRNHTESPVMHQIHNALLLLQVYFAAFLSMSQVFMKLKVALLSNCIVLNQHSCDNVPRSGVYCVFMNVRLQVPSAGEANAHAHTCTRVQARARHCLSVQVAFVQNEGSVLTCS